MALQVDFYDGKTALTHPAVCQFLGDVLEVRSRDGDLLATWALGDILDEASGKIPLRLRHAGNPGERLVVREAASITSFREWLAPVLAKRRSGTRLRWFFGSIAIWLVLALGWFGFPHAINTVADFIPYSWERTMGEESRDMLGRLLSGAYGGEIPWRDSGPGYEALCAIVARLAPDGGGQDNGTMQRFEVSILDAEMVNAFALPGGFIIVTTSLVRQCHTPDELAGVLAHEMAHVTERHNVRRLVRDQFFALSLSMLTGGSGLEEIAGAAAKRLFSEKFSREDERKADILGVRRLAHAKVHPESIAQFFARVPASPAEKTLLSYLESHPPVQDRQEYMRHEAAGFSGLFTPALDVAQWRALQNLCCEKKSK